MKKLTECPKCGCDNIFLSERKESGGWHNESFTIDYDGNFKIYSRRKGICNNSNCNQKFWLLSSGRITRRNK